MKNLMKKAFLNLLISVLCLASVHLLVSCAEKGDSKALSPAVSDNGTSDTGGGTGFDDKVFESYKVVPTELAAYKKILGPLLSGIEADSSPQVISLENVFKLKTWYVAPIELEKVGKDTLGISFIKTQTQQIARQTHKAIWISQDIFDRMALQDQSDLILHELVMNLYFLKFAKISDICEHLTLGLGPENFNKCKSDGAMLDQLRPAQEPRALDGDDNANIQFVTAWMIENLSNGKKIQRQQFHHLLLTKNFDPRFFSTYLDDASNQLPEETRSVEEIESNLVAASTAGTLPTVCVGISTKEKKKCKIEFISSSSSLMRLLTIKINIDGSVITEIQMPLPSKIALSASRDEKGVVYYTPLVHFSMSPKVGDKIYSGFIVLRKETSAQQSGFKIESIIVKPGIIASKDLERKPVCQLQSLKADSLANDGLIILQENSEPTLKENSLSAVPPFAACPSK